MTELTSDPPAAPTPPLDLPALYPACFDRANPRPLKRRIHKDLMAAGYLRKEAKRALARYCTCRAYLKALTVAGTPRIDLQGQPAGEVTEDDAADAQARLSGDTPPPKPRAERPQEPTPAPTPALPLDVPLTPENLVTGRLELTVKFTELPKPLPVKAGMKIGIQTDTSPPCRRRSGRSWNRPRATGRPGSPR